MIIWRYPNCKTGLITAKLFNFFQTVHGTTSSTSTGQQWEYHKIRIPNHTHIEMH